MQVSINFPAYHGTLNAGTALARLKTVDRPGAYLIRFNKDFIISYIAESGDIKHEIINNAKGTSLRDENPGLITISQTVDFLLKCDQTEKFVYLVSWRDFEEAAAFTNYRHDRHICHVCDRVFRDPAELYNHLQIHKFSFCKHCNKMIPRRYFIQHKIKCSEAPKDLVCHLCNNFSTRWKKCLKEHIKTMHGEDSTKCQICSKTFGNVTHLEKHMRTHNGYDCSICGRNFKSRQARAYHMKANHVDTDTDDADDPPPPGPDVSVHDGCCGGAHHHHCGPATQPQAHDPSASPSWSPPSSQIPASQQPSPSPQPTSPQTSQATSPLPQPTSPQTSQATSPLPQPASQQSSQAPSTLPQPTSPQTSQAASPLPRPASPPQEQLSPSQQPSSPPEFGPTDMTAGHAPAQESTPRRGRPYHLFCPSCNFKTNSKKRLKNHIKLVHTHKRAPPLHFCKFCKDSKNPEVPPFVTKYKKALEYHIKNSCLGKARVPTVLNPEELWDVISQVGLSNATAEKFLTALAKKLGYRFFPRYLKRVLSKSLNTFRQQLTCELLQFQDKTGELAEPTTLVYTEDLKRVIDKTIECRGIVKPFINIGIDGGKDKVIVVLQIFDLEDLSLDEATRKKKNKKSPLGRDRSIVIARGDYTVESPENIKLIYDKLRLRETMANYPEWQIIGDLKAHNSTCGA